MTTYTDTEAETKQHTGICKTCQQEFTKPYTSRRPTACDPCVKAKKEQNRSRKVYELNQQLDAELRSMTHPQAQQQLQAWCDLAISNGLPNETRQALTNPKLYERSAQEQARQQGKPNAKPANAMIRLNAYSREVYGVSFQTLAKHDRTDWTPQQPVEDTRRPLRDIQADLAALDTPAALDPVPEPVESRRLTPVAKPEPDDKQTIRKKSMGTRILSTKPITTNQITNKIERIEMN